MSKQTFILLVLLIFFGASLDAQRRIYPVVVDHKVGFINLRGKLIKQTDYDYVSERPMLYYQRKEEPLESRYYLVEKDGALGLIDAYLKPVLECQYLQIRVLSDNLFSVRTEAGFNLVERSGENLLQAYFTDFTVIGTNPGTRHTFLHFRQGEKKQLYQIGRGAFGPSNLDYVSLVPGETDLFVGKQTSGRRVVFDGTGKVLLQGDYESITPFNPYLFWVQRYNVDRQEALNRKGSVVFTSGEVSLKPLCGNLVQVIRQGSLPVLYDAATATYQDGPEGARSYFEFDWRYTEFKGENGRGLFSPDGRIVLEPNYRSISPFEDSLMLLNERGRKRLWSPRQGLLGQQSYFEIEPFDTTYYLIREATGAGLVRRSDWAEIISPQYTRFQLDADYIKAFDANKMVDIYQPNAAGVWEKQKDFANVRTINLKGSYQMAKRLKSSSTFSPSDSLDTFVPLETVKENTYQFVLQKFTKSYLLQGPNVEETRFYHYPIKKHLDIKFLGVTLTYTPRKVKDAGVRKLLQSTPDGLHALAFFKHERGDWIMDYAYWGLRRHDYLRSLPYAAALHTDGQFRLLDREGTPKKDANGETMRFSYIGEFINGYARAAVGGQLSQLKDQLYRKYAISTVEELEKRFEISRTDGKRVYNKTMWLNPESGEVRWGVIDTEGNWVVDPQYRYIKPPSGDQLVAQEYENQRWGVITRQGDVVIDFTYAGIVGMDEYWRVVVPSKGLIYFNEQGHQIMTNDYRKRGDYSEGLLLVSKNGQYGFLDSLGQEAIPCRYEGASDFAEGIAAVRENEQWKMIDLSGQVFDLPTGFQPDTIMSFQEGLCRFRQGPKTGFLNRELNVKINPRYVRVTAFDRGVARFWQGKFMGVIDTSGQELFSADVYHVIHPFDANGLAVVEQRGRQLMRGLVNNQGKTILEPKYSYIGPFKDGRAVVRQGRQAGYIDTSGQLVIPMQYSAARDFSEGLAMIQRIGKRYWEYIRPDGRLAFRGEYYVATPFQSGKAIVRTTPNNQAAKSLINNKGRIVQEELTGYRFWSPDHIGLVNKNIDADRYTRYYYSDLDGLFYFDRYFQDVTAFEGDLAVVQDRWRKGIINRRGRYVIPPKYVLLELEPDGSIKAGPPAFGLLDRQGNSFVEPLYDRITRMQGGLFRLEQGERVSYVNRKGEVIWE